jgi:hypothetical protein
MAEMGTIRKEDFTGVPLLLGADTLTEASSTGSSGDVGLAANLMFEIAYTRY